MRVNGRCELVWKLGPFLSNKLPTIVNQLFDLLPKNKYTPLSIFILQGC